MWRGAWKIHPCLLLPMKANITTREYHHNRQTHKPQGKRHRITSSHWCSIYRNLIYVWLELLLYIFLQWFNFKHWDILGAVFSWLGELAFQDFFSQCGRRLQFCVLNQRKCGIGVSKCKNFFIFERQLVL